MVTELRSAGSGLVNEAAFFHGDAALEKPKAVSPSVTQQPALISHEVRIEPVKTTFSALSDVKDAAAIAANAVREANKALDNAAAVSNFSQSDPNAVSDSQNSKAVSDSQNSKAVSDSQNSKAVSDSQNSKAVSDSRDSTSTQAGNSAHTKPGEALSQQQIAYLARLNAARVALQAQLEKLVGVLDVNLQQLTSESQAQIVAHTVTGQLGIALQPLTSNSDALKQLRA